MNKVSGNVFGAVTRIKPIIITFGVTNVVVLNSITYVTSIGVGSRDCDIIIVVQCQDIATFRTVPKR